MHHSPVVKISKEVVRPSESNDKPEYVSVVLTNKSVDLFVLSYPLTAKCLLAELPEI